MNAQFFSSFLFSRFFVSYLFSFFWHIINRTESQANQQMVYIKPKLLSLDDEHNDSVCNFKWLAAYILLTDIFQCDLE